MAEELLYRGRYAIMFARLLVRPLILHSSSVLEVRAARCGFFIFPSILRHAM